MVITIPYLDGVLSVDAPWAEVLSTLDVAETPALDSPVDTARNALESPIGLANHAFSSFRRGERVAIVVPDSFRKSAIHEVLPCVIDELEAAGILEKDISFVYATGTHRGPTREEEDSILGRALRARFEGRTFAHDPDDPRELVQLGVTHRGTPVWLNRRVHEADRIIATGTVVLHYFGGFGGGRKSIVPGVAGRATISHNHAMNLDPHEDRLNPAVRIGALDGNPVAEDMLEAARMTHVDCIVNTVLNRAGHIAGLFVGEMDAAHRAACDFARRLYGVDIEKRADIVVAASNSTRNFLQTHKALFNAYQAVTPNGRIILAAPCPEGIGGEQFKKWLRLGSREAIIAGLRAASEINGQTALSTIHKGPITLLLTEMSEADVQMLKARKAVTLEAALEAARQDLAAQGIPRPTVYLMPSAAYTVPACSD